MTMPKSAKTGSTIKQFEKLNRTGKGIDLQFNRLRCKDKFHGSLTNFNWERRKKGGSSSYTWDEDEKILNLSHMFVKLAFMLNVVWRSS